MWMSNERVDAAEWSRLHNAHERSGLWPMLLLPLHLSRDDEFRPWGSGELFPRPDPHLDGIDPEQVLVDSWADCVAPEGADEGEDAGLTAPYGQRWPGLAQAPVPVGSAEARAARSAYAHQLVDAQPSARLGLVHAVSGAEALTVIGWSGPVNHKDIREVSAVLRSWEERFGAVVVGAGFDVLHVSVAAVPQSLEEALPIAAEHFAICPDNVWQGPGTLITYAEQLIGSDYWEFWWD
jgi:hypothetical protein